VKGVRAGVCHPQQKTGKLGPVKKLDMNDSIDPPFAESKISTAFLEFAQPILGEEGSLTAGEIEKILRVAFVAWNAVVYDTVHGNTEWVTRLRTHVAPDAALAAVVEDLITRKRARFGNDLRLVGSYKVVESDGEWRLRVEARLPT
jgi:hypothetical protein